MILRRLCQAAARSDYANHLAVTPQLAGRPTPRYQVAEHLAGVELHVI